MVKIAFYDMDKTITRRPTYTPFLLHMIRYSAPWRVLLLPLMLVGVIGYALKLVDRSGLKTFNQRLALGAAADPRKLQPHLESFAEKVLQSNLSADAQAQIEADRKAGYRLVMATASYEIYVAGIAERLGFDDVIATELKRDAQGHILAEIDGENCYAAAKMARINDYLQSQKLDAKELHIRAYSDHVSDAPMLHYADEAFATNAHAPLRALAEQRGWKVVDWD